MANSNPYATRLGDAIRYLDKDSIVDYILREHVTPRNQKIHKLTVEVARLNASVLRLGKVLSRHNPGVCKDDESPIDCAIRMLSPVRDTTPSRDRP